MMKISRNFPLYTLQSHLVSMQNNFAILNPCEVDARWEWPHEVRMVMEGDFCIVEGTIQHIAWDGNEMKMATLVKFAKSPHIHTRQLYHFMATQNGKVVLFGCDMTLGRCYLSDVQAANDEDFQKFSLTYFCKVSSHPRKTTLPFCVHARWEWPCKVTITIQGDFCVVEGTTQHTMWGGCEMRMAMWGEICKVTSCPHEITLPFCMDARWLWVDVTSAMSKAQMMKKISTNFPLYTFAKSPHVHMRQYKMRMATWGKNGHARWLAWWRGQLDTQCEVDMRWEWPHEVRSAKSHKTTLPPRVPAKCQSCLMSTWGDFG